MNLPDCYEADRQFDAMDRAQTARMMRKPKCVKCETHILSENYLDLSDFGLDGFVCERCVENATHATDDLED
jgi:hypothetical protein